MRGCAERRRKAQGGGRAAAAGAVHVGAGQRDAGVHHARQVDAGGDGEGGADHRVRHVGQRGVQLPRAQGHSDVRRVEPGTPPYRQVYLFSGRQGRYLFSGLSTFRSTETARIARTMPYCS